MLPFKRLCCTVRGYYYEPPPTHPPPPRRPISQNSSYFFSFFILPFELRNNIPLAFVLSHEQVKAGVVNVLSELSTSYKEKNQLYCARALCNLACHHGSERALVEGGGVAALMMIALVRRSHMPNRTIKVEALVIRSRTRPSQSSLRCFRVELRATRKRVFQVDLWSFAWNAALPDRSGGLTRCDGK